MSELVFDAIGKYIHPTHYRQIVETQSLNVLKSKDQIKNFFGRLKAQFFRCKSSVSEAEIAQSCCE